MLLDLWSQRTGLIYYAHQDVNLQMKVMHTQKQAVYLKKRIRIHVEFMCKKVRVNSSSTIIIMYRFLTEYFSLFFRVTVREVSLIF